MTDYYSLIPNFKKEIPAFLNQSKNFAIFKVNQDPKSLGYRIFENLKKDFKVFPIGEETEILGEKCYSDLSEINKKIEAVIITTSPKKTLGACRECSKNKILKIWIEAGSESKEALDFCKKENINIIYLHSILKEIVNPSFKRYFKEES